MSPPQEGKGAGRRVAMRRGKDTGRSGRQEEERPGMKREVGMGEGHWRESDNRGVFSHRFTRAIGPPFSPALIDAVSEPKPLKILLRFHKKNPKRRRVNERRRWVGNIPLVILRL